MKKIINALVLLLVVVTPSLAQIAEKAESGKFALTNAKVFTVTNGVLDNATVLINGKTIEYVGTDAKFSEEYQKIDCSGKSIYPGFIDSGTQLGLIEVSAVDAANHGREVGDFNPHIRAFSGVDMNAVAIPVTRVSGVTTVITYPQGSLVTGMAFLMNLYGYVSDSASVKPDAGLYLNFPRSGRRGSRDTRDEKKIAQDNKEALDKLSQYFIDAAQYDAMWKEFEASKSGKKQPNRDIKMDAMRKVVNGEIPVIIDVDREKDILEAIKWVKSHDNLRAIFTSVEEGWRVADQIAEAEIQCLVGPILRTASRDYDGYAKPYQNAGILHKAGVLVAVHSGSTENSRNLVYNAAYAGVYGMGIDAALEAITINPAKIFGVENLVGSIETGKIANLFISEGDAFETRNTVEQVFIDGLKIPMVSRHTLLHDEFLERDVRK